MRNTETLKYNWQFIKGEQKDGAEITCDSASWETVRVPHDWAIYGPFDEENDIHTRPIVEDGENKEKRHTGRTGGLPHVGIGWYRRALDIPADFGQAGADQRAFLEFDGVMSHSTVYVNGKEAGGRPFGYSSFQVEITDLVTPGENLLAVRVDNPPLASRWYPGAGIYRNVRLVLTGESRIGYNGIHLVPELVVPEADGKNSKLKVKVNLESRTGGNLDGLTIQSVILDPQGNPLDPEEIVEITDSESEHKGEVSLEHPVPSPMLWELDKPHLYECVISLIKNDEVIDQMETSFGFRSVVFDPQDGLFLNGKPVMIKGVCQHHDLGPLGAAVNHRGLERQLEILQSMGCNAIRTSHNPPEPMLLDLCDRMGFLVMDEAFDEWRVAKVANGYHTLFDEWAERDLTDLIQRDRNHPSIIMWSIGNEIGDQDIPAGRETGRMLADIVRREDSTRLITAGFNRPDGALKYGLAREVDIPGWNYKPHRYEEFREHFPRTAMIGSETSSCVSTRGYYHFPAQEVKMPAYESLQCSSYDLDSPPWATIPDVEFAAQDNLEYMCGEFVWTGFDYLGEPTPYGEQWPSRSSYFGIVDLVGFPKDRYYLYKSVWSFEPVLHLLPHWTWPNREGLVTPVHCYTNYDHVELFLNNESLGHRSKRDSQVPEDITAEARMGEYRLVWDNVVYKPGKLEAVAYDEHGREAARTAVETAGDPSAMKLEADRSEFQADGDDLVYIAVELVDDRGRFSPLGDNLVQFSLEGPGEILAVGNGDPTSLASFQDKERKAFYGRCMVIIRSIKGKGGKIILTASSAGMESVKVTFHSVKE
jgi:beta-galactosidase